MNPTVCSSGQRGMSSEFPSARLSQSTWEWRCPWGEYWIKHIPSLCCSRTDVQAAGREPNTWQEMNAVSLSCSSTELLVVHLCGFDESVACSAPLDMASVTEIRYPSNTQVDRKERRHSDQSQLSQRQEVMVQLRHAGKTHTKTHIIFLPSQDSSLFGHIHSFLKVHRNWGSEPWIQSILNQY